MAALRQFLNGRGYIKDDGVGPSPTAPSSEESSKMHSMNYSISPPLPQKQQASSLQNRYDQTGNRPLHSKFNDVEPGNWTHPALRKHGGSDASNQDYTTRGNSTDQESRYRPAPLRSATTDNIPSNTRASATGFDMDQSSLYEENESPALSPALNKHLALRPRDAQDDLRRRRSRSVTEDDRYFGTGDHWDGYGKDTPKQSRKDSILSTSKPLPDTKESRAVQLLKDRQRPPTRQDSVNAASNTNKHLPSPAQILTQQAYQGRFDNHARNESVPQGPTKVAHTLSNDSSPTDSVNTSDSGSGQGRSRNLKRSRDLDYSIHGLADMNYQQLKDESFDHVPGAAKILAQFDLPNPNLGLSDRLQQIYEDKSHKDRELRARGFFSSLTIDQYEECGDLLLDGFRKVMERLKYARQQKRRAARNMEELIAKREELVRRKRGIIEQDLGRLKSAGSAVVKPK
ncbi:uncharacterized protein KY384_004183 [Bacidia gigantensis]|uniref:uncharacterized protein n=1 Tax=Bacidia gigantensis TaxID=2732470 RepID=UPI001D04A865|nr:uncharacterized protein KY384_004183 [Bacidia gigantensis]KAG8530826.1 hypothetical protein KY384_004183 [Bacidia gigantensis]